MAKLKIKKNDEVLVITGKDKGKRGKVLHVLTKSNQIIVSGINLAKKHSKATQASAAGIFTKEMPIHISNVAHIDPKLDIATKVKFKFLDDGVKVRVAKKSEEVIHMAGK